MYKDVCLNCYQQLRSFFLGHALINLATIVPQSLDTISRKGESTVPSTPNQVVSFRDPNSSTGTMYRVFFNGRLCSPEWHQHGPAEAYLFSLNRGERDPEYNEHTGEHVTEETPDTNGEPEPETEKPSRRRKK
jgi:hypothetical protein